MEESLDRGANRVLVVGSDPVARRELSRELQTLGHVVDESELHPPVLPDGELQLPWAVVAEVEGDAPDIDWLIALTAAHPRVVLGVVLAEGVAPSRALQLEENGMEWTRRPVTPSALARLLDTEASAPPDEAPAPPLAEPLPPWLAELRQGYGGRLPELASEVAQACRADGASLADPAAAKLAAHRLAGTASTYGFPEVGDASRRIEALLEDSCGSPDVETVSRLVQELVAAATASAADFLA